MQVLAISMHLRYEKKDTLSPCIVEGRVPRRTTTTRPNQHQHQRQGKGKGKEHRTNQDTHRPPILVRVQILPALHARNAQQPTAAIRQHPYPPREKEDHTPSNR